MQNVSSLPKGIRYLFSDIDDTMTTHGKLPADVYEMLWKLSAADIAVIPVTGRPAGWCDMIARFWPVRGIVGENGAFYFSYDEKNKKMIRHWVFDDKTRRLNAEKLAAIEKEVLNAVPAAAVSSDQFSRVFDLAIDFCEDVAPLSKTEVQTIVSIFEKNGAVAKVSSIHVNGWFGSHDKFSMCREFCKKELQFDFEAQQDRVAFVGDSPNDEPMFAAFRNSIGVANVNAFASTLKSPPQFVCSGDGGAGFVELGQILLKNK